MPEVAAEDRDRLRATPAYRRAVLSGRLLLLTAMLMPVIFLLAVLQLPEVVGTGLFALGFLAAGVGVALGWSSVLPLEKAKRAILTKYQLDPFERALLMNGMLIRDVVKILRRSSSDGTTSR